MSTFLRDQLQGMRINRIKSRVREAWSKRQQHGECDCPACSLGRGFLGGKRVVKLSDLLGGIAGDEHPEPQPVADPAKKLQ